MQIGLDNAQKCGIITNRQGQETIARHNEQLSQCSTGGNDMMQVMGNALQILRSIKVITHDCL